MLGLHQGGRQTQPLEKLVVFCYSKVDSDKRRVLG